MSWPLHAVPPDLPTPTPSSEWAQWPAATTLGGTLAQADDDGEDSRLRLANDSDFGNRSLGNDTQPPDLNSFYFFHTAQFAVLWVLFVLIVLGNSAVLLALAFNKHRKSRMNFFIMQLAIADLAVGLISVPTDLVWRMTVEWHAGNLACKLIRYLQVLVTYSSTYVLVALSIDRYDAITHPMNFSRSGRRSRFLVAGAWTLSCLFAVPILVLFEEREVEGHCQCWIELPQRWHWRLYITLVALALFALPALIISACYTVIVCTIWNKSHSMSSRGSVEGGPQRASSAACVPPRAARWSLEGLEGLEGLEPDGLDAAHSPDGPGCGAKARGAARGAAKASKEPRGRPGASRSSSRVGSFRPRLFAASQGASLGSMGSFKSSREEPDCRRASSRGLIPRAKVKTVKMTLVIVFVFVLCWSPYFVLNLLQVYDHIPRTQTNIAVASFVQSLAPLNSAANPLIYCLFSSHICRTLRKVPPFTWMLALRESPAADNHSGATETMTHLGTSARRDARDALHRHRVTIRVAAPRALRALPRAGVALSAVSAV